MDDILEHFSSYERSQRLHETLIWYNIKPIYP